MIRYSGSVGDNKNYKEEKTQHNINPLLKSAYAFSTSILLTNLNSLDCNVKNLFCYCVASLCCAVLLYGVAVGACIYYRYRHTQTYSITQSINQLLLHIINNELVGAFKASSFQTLTHSRTCISMPLAETTAHYAHHVLTIE